MGEENTIQDKSYKFALRIVKLNQYLRKEKKEFVLSNQLLRCGTSVGANVEEAQGGQTKKDFFAKLSIANKEARETRYWLKLLRDSGFLNESESDSMLSDLEELLKLLSSILLTTKRRIEKPE